jgi:hypothetical protein
MRSPCPPHSIHLTLDHILTTVTSMDAAANSHNFGDLVFEETIRRALRKTPEQRLDTLRAAVRDAEQRGLVPKRDRAAHEKKLLCLIQQTSSRN